MRREGRNAARGSAARNTGAFGNLAGAALVLCGAGCAHDEFSTGVWVHDLRIEGNKEVTTGDIEEGLATVETGWWPFASKKWFDQAAFDLDLQRIVALYGDRGFFDARVTSHEVKKRSDESVDVVLKIEEGSPTRITSVVFQAFPPELEADARRIAKIRDIVPGALFRYDDYQAIKTRLDKRLKEDGFAYGEIESITEVERDKHEARITYTSKPGPKVRFGKTTLDGNGAIPTWKLLNRVTWKEGGPYNPNDLATTQGRLYNLGVFSSVRIELAPEPTEVADVAIHVQPGPLHRVQLGGGVGAETQREEVRGRAEWTIVNFLGGLRKLRIRLHPAYVFIPSLTDIQQRGFAAENDIQLTQPDIFGSNASFHALAGYDLGISEGYQFYGPRGEVGVERPFFRDRVLAGLTWNLQYLTFFNVDQDVFGGASDRFFGFKNPYRLTFVEEFAQLDLRDRPLDPTSGAYLMVRAEQGDPAIGSDFHYLKLTPEVRGYVPVSRRVVVAARGLGGWIGTYAGEESPITRRFRLGGPSSHRGFSVGRLSPQAQDKSGRRIPLGGDGQILLSGELRIEVTKIGGAWLDLVPFLDAGDVTAHFADLSLRNLHYASGLSVEYATPIGIVRAGAGVRLNRMGGNNPDPDSRVAFHITIGEAF